MVVSGATAEKVRGYFNMEQMQDLLLPGDDQAAPVLQVTHESGARNRVEARDSLIAFNGRAHELELMKSRWQDTVAGRGHIVLLNGEAGMGKSRLIYELKQHVAMDPSAWVSEAYCSSDQQNKPLHAIVDLLETNLLRGADDDADRLSRLEGYFAQFAIELEPTVPLFAELLGVATGDRYETPQLSPKRKKELLIEAFIDQKRVYIF